MVIPYAKDQVKHAPKAGRDHVLDSPHGVGARRALRGALTAPIGAVRRTTTVTAWPISRRILLDGYPTLVERRGEHARRRRRAAGGRRRRRPPPARRADEDHLRPPELRQPGRRVHDEAAGGADVLPQADHRAQRARRRRGPSGAVPVAQLRGRDRHRHRPTCRNVAPADVGAVHRRLHGRQRLRPARLPRHRRRLDAARQGLRHAVPDRAGPRRPTGTSATSGSARSSTARSARTAPPPRWSGTCTTSWPTSPARSRSCRATCCCRARRPTPARSSPATSSRVEVEGLGALTNRIVSGPTPIRADVGAQPSESEEVRSTALGGDWEHRGMRAPRGPGAQHYESTVDESDDGAVADRADVGGRGGQPRPPDRRPPGAVADDVRGPLAARLVVEAGRRGPRRRGDGARRGHRSA